MRKIIAVMLYVMLMLPLSVFGNENSDNKYKHKTGLFSDITPQEYVENIKIGFNYMSNEFNFGLDNWVEAANVPSIPLALMASGSVEDVWLSSGQTVLYKGDSKHVKLRFRSEPGDVPEGSANINFTIHIKKDVSFELMPIKLEINNTKVTMRDGTGYFIEALNGTHELELVPEDNGHVTGYGVEVPLSKAQLDGAHLEADITIIDAPASQATKIYMADISQNYITDLKYFDAMKDAGFNAVRLNIDWYFYIDNATFEIDEEYLRAIERVVGYCTDLDMFVMITAQDDYTPYTHIKPYVGDHNEAAWMLDEYKPYVDERFAAMWTQIAEWFKDYDEYVLFQPFNEPCMTDFSDYGDNNPFDTWEDYKELSIRRVNEMNQIFVDIVRATGGNNEKRFLLFEKFDAVFPLEPLESIVIPDDDNLILSLHCYPGYNQDNDFAPAQEWGVKERTYADRLLQWISDFKDKTGIPVILDETAATLESPHTVRIETANYFIGKAKELGVPCYWWECISPYDPNTAYNFALGYDLLSETWMHQDLLDAIMDVVYSDD